MYIDCYIKTSWELQTKKLRYTHKKEKATKHNTKDSHQITRDLQKQKDLQKSKTIKKMAIGMYISIITLNIYIKN